MHLYDLLTDRATKLSKGDTPVQGAVTLKAEAEKASGQITSVDNGLLNVTNLGEVIEKVIKELVNRKEPRSSLLMAILYEIQFQTQGLCNCVIFNLDKRHEMGLDGTQHFQLFRHEEAIFGVWVVQGGYFQSQNPNTNKEDFWGYAGSMNSGGSSQDLITFDNRPCTAV